jgi:dUTPase
MLESIALSFGLKSFASYILNCTSKVLIFTDAKSLIYAKRNSTHSILLNSKLTYLQNFVSLVNVKSNSTLSINNEANRADTRGCQDYRDYGKCKHTPCIIYSFKKDSKYPPLRDCVTNSICLRTQEDITLRPNEYKKIDLGLKIFSKRYNPVQLTPKLSTRLTYSLNIMTGLVDMHYRNCLQIGIHNLSTETVWIPAGTAVCKIHSLKYLKRTIDEYELDIIDHGGELSPFNLYIDRLMKHADRDEILYAKIKEKLDKYPVEGPGFADIKCNTIEVMVELDEIAPESIDIEFMNIKLLGEE